MTDQQVYSGMWPAPAPVIPPAPRFVGRPTPLALHCCSGRLPRRALRLFCHPERSDLTLSPRASFAHQVAQSKDLSSLAFLRFILRLTPGLSSRPERPVFFFCSRAPAAYWRDLLFSSPARCRSASPRPRPFFVIPSAGRDLLSPSVPCRPSHCLSS